MLRLLGNVLASGQSSRLYQKLVKEKEVAVGVFGGEQERRGPALFSLTVNVRPGKDLGEVEKLVYDEIERLKVEPAANWEMEKVRALVRRQRAQQVQGTLFRSILIGQYAVFYNDPSLINTIEEHYNKVTKDDLQRVAKNYLKESNRTVITTLPKPKEAPSKSK
jgi:predicted Zn-dependent peptidase